MYLVTTFFILALVIDFTSSFAPSKQLSPSGWRAQSHGRRSQSSHTATVSPLLPILNGFIAGSTGACSTGAFVAYPLDYVKTILQTPSGRSEYGTSTLKCFTGIIKKDGVLGIYKGLPLQLLGVAPKKTIKLSTNSLIRTLLTHNNHLSLLSEIIAGAVAGLSQDVVTVPLENVKTKMQTSSLSFLEVLKSIKSFNNLFSGGKFCVYRDVIFSAVLFPCWGHLKVIDYHISSPWNLCISGFLAAIPAAFLATPFDTIKTRIQQVDSDVKGYFWREEELGVLFSGAGERVLRSGVQFSVTFGVYEYLMNNI